MKTRDGETADDKDKRKMVGSELRKAEEEERMTQAVTMASKGAWMKWESTVNRKITWNNTVEDGTRKNPDLPHEPPTI